jgi:hypothetical protein
MIYTVGRKDIYDPEFEKRPKGITKCKGGSVWESLEKAQSYLNRTNQAGAFGIYVIEANWHLDTEPDPDNDDNTDFRALKEDAKCVKLPADPKPTETKKRFLGH